MKVAISSGHGLKVAGAGALIQEVPEARKVVATVAANMKLAGAAVLEFHENNATNQSANVSAIISWHNSQNRDLDVSVHFNCASSTIVDRAIGTEVLYLTQEALAAKVSKAIADFGRFINRGAKKRTDLGFLNNTNKPAILVEVCFVDSREDVRLYQANYEAICRAMASSITGLVIPGEPTPPPNPPPVPTDTVVTVYAPKGVRIEVKEV